MSRLLFISGILVVFLSHCDCSPKSPIDEVVKQNSVAIEAKKVPYHAALEYDHEIICSGSGISSRFVLTAAHCLMEVKQMRKLTVIFQKDAKNGGYAYRVRKLFTHPSYREKKYHDFDYDVGIIEMKKSIEHPDYVAITLIEPHVDLCDDTYMTLTGYQGDDFGLYLVFVPKVSEASCYNSYLYLNGVTPRMVCAGKNGTDSCRGDGGSPLVKNLYQYGIKSWGHECGNPLYPEVYTYLSSPIIRRWIEQLINI